MLLVLLMIAFMACSTIQPVRSQSDVCSLRAVIASFEAAALSESVDLWLQRYEASDCAPEVLRTVALFVRGYEAYFNEEVSEETGVIGTIPGNNPVNVRRGPNSNYPIVGQYSPGTQFPVVARNSDSSWYLIILPNGIQGWINASFVSILGDATTIEIAATLPAPP